MVSVLGLELVPECKEEQAGSQVGTCTVLGIAQMETPDPGGTEEGPLLVPLRRGEPDSFTTQRSLCKMNKAGTRECFIIA